jgi:hypothetical protein
VLFRINMCRLDEAKRERLRKRAHYVAVVVTVLGVNAVAGGLFVQSLLVTDSALDAAGARVELAEEAMARVTGEGVTLSDEQIEVLNRRLKRVRWSSALRDIAHLAVPEVWLTRMIVTDGVPAGGGEPVLGLHVYGTLKAARREEGVDQLMGFVQSIRTDPRFREDFLEAALVAMNWADGANAADGIEFEIFCPLARPDAGEL